MTHPPDSVECPRCLGSGKIRNDVRYVNPDGVRITAMGEVVDESEGPTRQCTDCLGTGSLPKRVITPKGKEQL